MNSAGRFCVYATFAGLSVLHSTRSFSKNRVSNDSVSVTDNSESANEFQWSEHSRLSWEDFRGMVKASNDESAAATHCGIGFKVNLNNPGKPEITVYNTFYANKSWVRPDARVQSILNHEQGHFDLCEIYTRKLKMRMKDFDFNVPDVRQALVSIYKEISDAYEERQQIYEQETVHGTNIEQQQKWSAAIASELSYQ